MNSSPATLNKAKTTKSHEVAWQRWGMLYLRLALGVSFLSGSPTALVCIEGGMSATAILRDS